MKLTGSQTREFLDAVAALPPLPTDVSGLGPAIETRAQLTGKLVVQCFGIQITNDSAGVQLLDQLLNAMHDSMNLHGLAKWSSREASEADANLVAVSLGALFGEINRARFEGEWDLAEIQGRRFIVLSTPHGQKFTPLQKAGKQFLNGKEDSILFTFGLVGKIAEAAARIAKLSPEEREARRKQALDTIAKRRAAGREKGLGESSQDSTK
ncbi:MAG: hypothetical protein WBL63_06155 [Candidatus Acidiferrum sp.]